MKVFVIQFFLGLSLMSYVNFGAMASCPPCDKNPQKIAISKTLQIRHQKPQKQVNPKTSPSNKLASNNKLAFPFMLLNPLFANLHFLNSRFVTEPDTLGA